MKKKIEDFWDEINKNFWCLNANKENTIETLLNGNLRFAKKKEIIPNIKLKICRKEIDFLTLREKVKVNFPKNRYIYISPIELQIIYKEEVLKSEKDIEDALHLREVFKNVIDEKKIEEYKK